MPITTTDPRLVHVHPSHLPRLVQEFAEVDMRFAASTKALANAGTRAAALPLDASDPAWAAARTNVRQALGWVEDHRKELAALWHEIESAKDGGGLDPTIGG